VATERAQTRVAALYVLPDGPYAALPDVEVWDITRDARQYQGPHPVVAHPPCERWGRYWSGGPSARMRRLLGDDNGCFAHALHCVRTYGGVLEHPADSAAWRAHGLFLPSRDGGWVYADWLGGWTCCVEQGWYGHFARKATWLYAAHVVLPSLHWGRAPGQFVRLDAGDHSQEARLQGRDHSAVERLSHRQRQETPAPFRDLLLAMARSVYSGEPGTTRRALSCTF
jgi:hypothetical protein